MSTRFTFLDIGFHGDKYLLSFVDAILSRCGCFIETGANVGSTLAYVARTYPHIQCLSCEPDHEAYLHSVENIKTLNAILFNESSQAFLYRLQAKYAHLFDRTVLFWLDAHGYGFEWPLKQEVSFITQHFKSAYILIDDFKVPGLDCFGYDKYGNQECSFDYLKDSLNSRIRYDIYYPAYTDKTSKHHPLRGWGLLAYGQDSKFEVPESIKNKIQIVRYK
jgi:hypothetical protein